MFQGISSQWIFYLVLLSPSPPRSSPQRSRIARKRQKERQILASIRASRCPAAIERGLPKEIDNPMAVAIEMAGMRTKG
jgi:hypothetical protein